MKAGGLKLNHQLCEINFPRILLTFRQEFQLDQLLGFQAHISFSLKVRFYLKLKIYIPHTTIDMCNFSRSSLIVDSLQPGLGYVVCVVPASNTTEPRHGGKKSADSAAALRTVSATFIKLTTLFCTHEKYIFLEKLQKNPAFLDH